MTLAFVAFVFRGRSRSCQPAQPLHHIEYLGNL